MKKAVWAATAVLGSVVMAGCLGLTTIMQGEGDKPDSSHSQSVPEPMHKPRIGTIGEGTWEVGPDVEPGKYKTSGALDSVVPLCYWHVEVDGQIIDQGVSDSSTGQGIVTLDKGDQFKTNGCAPWVLDTTKGVGWVTPQTVPINKRKVYVVETLPRGWPVTSAQAFVDRYTGSNWVMANSCPANAYRCIFVKPGNLDAPRLAETRNYRSARVTIIVDLTYASPRLRTQAARKWALAHEFGHAAGLAEHSRSCRNLMYANTRCRGYALSASQRRTMHAR